MTPESRQWLSPVVIPHTASHVRIVVFWDISGTALAPEIVYRHYTIIGWVVTPCTDGIHTTRQPLIADLHTDLDTSVYCIEEMHAESQRWTFPYDCDCDSFPEALAHAASEFRFRQHIAAQRVEPA